MPFPQYDPGQVGGFGLFSLIASAIAIPLWRKFLAQQKTATDSATGESGWMKRQADKINEQERVITDLVRLRQTDAELIAALRLKEALAGERNERLIEHIERLNRRSHRLEDLICEIRPDLAKWVRTDFAELGEPELLDQFFDTTIPPNERDSL